MKLKLLMALLLCSPLFVDAHGEDKPGPHGGVIRMPGAFHTEALVKGPRTLQVYLLDLDWKNPTTKNSVLSASLDAKAFVDCQPQAESFECTFTKGDLKKKGTLTLRAKREGLPGNETNYPLPLVVPKAPATPPASGHHH